MKNNNDPLEIDAELQIKRDPLKKSTLFNIARDDGDTLDKNRQIQVNESIGSSNNESEKKDSDPQSVGSFEADVLDDEQ